MPLIFPKLRDLHSRRSDWPCLQLLLLVVSLLMLLPEDCAAEAPVFEPGAKPRKLLAEGAGEGPAWHPALGTFFSGHNGITLLDHKATSSLFFPEAGSNGLLFDSQGRLLICQPKYRRVSRMDLATGELQVLSDQYQGMKYNQPNDLTVDSKGRIYFSDPKYGERDSMEMVDEQGRKVEGVYLIDTDGKVTRVITHEVDRPNGLLVTPDGRLLFVADNNNNVVGAARKLWRFELRDDGTVNLESKQLVYDWKTGRGPDGMAIDRQGQLHVAGGRNEANMPFETAQEHKGGVYVFSATGKRLGFVPIPHDEVTNCAFGGPDLKTLFITAGGTLWTIRTSVPGNPAWPTPNQTQPK